MFPSVLLSLWTTQTYSDGLWKGISQRNPCQVHHGNRSGSPAHVRIPSADSRPCRTLQCHPSHRTSITSRTAQVGLGPVHSNRHLGLQHQNTFNNRHFTVFADVWSGNDTFDDWTSPIPPSEHQLALEVRQHQIRELFDTTLPAVRQKVKDKQLKQQEAQNRRHKIVKTTQKVGDTCYARIDSMKNKLEPRFNGPYQITALATSS